MVRDAQVQHTFNREFENPVQYFYEVTPSELSAPGNTDSSIFSHIVWQTPSMLSQISVFVKRKKWIPSASI
jgi:hypothetical protein